MLKFNCSEKFTIGVELEIQIINRDNGDLIPMAYDVIQHFQNNKFSSKVKPEITQSMLEINSSVHDNPHSLLEELQEIRNAIVEQAKKLDLYLCGGGTHHFQHWNERTLYPSFKTVGNKYGYLAKMLTVFGMHIHVGCPSGDNAIYLANALGRFLPHLIGLSASSPFCQGVDTAFDSSRLNVVNAFPYSGMLPIQSDWDSFCAYLEKMQELKIVERIDNFYWDIRPRPEYGTVEIRVCDAPLTLEKVAMLASYVQVLARYIDNERPQAIQNDNCGLYCYNRFQASRHGLNGVYIEPFSQQRKNLAEDILETCFKLEGHSIDLRNDYFLMKLIHAVKEKNNDAKWLREHFSNGKSLSDLVRSQSHLWMGTTAEQEALVSVA